MKRGIRVCPGMSAGDLREAGFEWLEMEWNIKETSPIPLGFLGSLGVPGAALRGPEELGQALKAAESLGASFLTIGTRELEMPGRVEELLAGEMGRVLASGLSVCIENGYALRRGRPAFHSFSEGPGLRAAADRLNALAGRRVFGTGLDMEAAILLGLNPGELARELGESLMCVGAADNGGEEPQGQLPYTFTRGRGERSTDWPGLVRGLWETGYSGPVVFRTPGLFSGLPGPLFPAMTRLLGETAREWERQLSFERRLKEAQGNLILFGCGIRFENYMTSWGGKYPPALAADNNPAWHGKRKRGVLVAPAERILDFDPGRRLILICCEQYEGIGRQLREMGADYEVYDDAYWGRYIVGSEERYVSGRSSNKRDCGPQRAPGGV